MRHFGTNRNSFNKEAITLLRLSRKWQGYIHHDPPSSTRPIRTSIT